MFMFLPSKASVKSFSVSGGALARGDRIPSSSSKIQFSQMVRGSGKKSG